MQVFPITLIYKLYNEILDCTGRLWTRVGTSRHGENCSPFLLRSLVVACSPSLMSRLGRHNEETISIGEVAWLSEQGER